MSETTPEQLAATPPTGGDPAANPATSSTPPLTAAAAATAPVAPVSSAALASPTLVERDHTALEKLVLAQVAEQRSARHWRNAIRIGWLLFFVVLAWVMFSRSTVSATDKAKAHTALVEIKGEIGAGSDVSAENVVPAIRAAFEDDAAQAVVLLINSPGGSPVQAGIINDEIVRLKTKHKKPIYTVVEEACASAAYYIAAGTDEIYVDKASIVGSIGVLMDGFGFVGLLDKLGIERRLMTAGEHKGFLDPFSPQTPRQRELAQKMLDEVHQQFIGVVRAGRGKRLKESPEIYSGLFWSGQQAISLGLADKLGNVEFVAREVVKAEDLVDYTQRPNLAAKLAKRFGAAIGEGAVKAMREAPALR